MDKAAHAGWWHRPTPIQQLSEVVCRVVVQEKKPTSARLTVRQPPSRPSSASDPRRPLPSSTLKARTPPLQRRPLANIAASQQRSARAWVKWTIIFQAPTPGGQMGVLLVRSCAFEIFPIDICSGWVDAMCDVLPVVWGGSIWPFALCAARRQAPHTPPRPLRPQKFRPV